MNHQTNSNGTDGTIPPKERKRHGNTCFIAASVALLLVIVGLGIFLYWKTKSSRETEESHSLSTQAQLLASEETPKNVADKIERQANFAETSVAGENAESPAQQEEVSLEERTSEADEGEESSAEDRDVSEEAVSSEEPEQKPSEKAEAPVATSSDPETRVIDFATLQAKKNADIYAWISVPGTNVDYPVLRHPTDDGYYLYHNLNGSQGYPGCIYTENWNSKDWNDPVTVLYGHDMRSTGTMFHQLHKFEKQDFFDKHQYFYVYTPEKTLKYEIFSAYVHTNEHLLYNHNFSDKTEFDSFFSTVLATDSGVSHVRSGVAIDSSSKIVTLSTCIKNKPDNRYLIFGVLVN